MQKQKLHLKNIKSEFAIASLVMGIASFVNIMNFEKAIVAVAFGVLALRSIKRSQLSGKKLAIAGIVLGILYIVTSVAMYIMFWPQLQEMQQKLKSAMY